MNTIHYHTCAKSEDPSDMTIVRPSDSIFCALVNITRVTVVAILIIWW